MADTYPPFRVFMCPACDKDKEMDKDELITHLASHGIDAYKVQGTRQMVLHLNKNPRHSGTFEWTFGEGGLKIYEYYG